MAKIAGRKKQTKPSDKDQFERFRQAARDLGVDNEKSAKTFERAFKKIVPPKKKRA
jgi:hypothetical protein